MRSRVYQAAIRRYPATGRSTHLAAIMAFASGKD
jgi:hypothetical protein